MKPIHIRHTLIFILVASCSTVKRAERDPQIKAEATRPAPKRGTPLSLPDGYFPSNDELRTFQACLRPIFIHHGCDPSGTKFDTFGPSSNPIFAPSSPKRAKVINPNDFKTEAISSVMESGMESIFWEVGKMLEKKSPCPLTPKQLREFGRIPRSDLRKRWLLASGCPETTVATCPLYRTSE